MAAVTSGSSLYGSMLRRCLGASDQAVCDNASRGLLHECRAQRRFRRIGAALASVS